MLKDLPGYAPPSGVRLWRYVDFTKFVSFLDTGSLFFSRADLLGDPFEGSYPLANVRDSTIYEQVLPPGTSGNQRLEDLGRDLREMVKRFRNGVFVNCWHMNPHESAAMWKLYLKSEEGLAIQSTKQRFSEAFSQAKEEVYLAEIRYLDYECERFLDPSLLAPFLHKRKSFEHERELRVFTWDFSCLDTDCPPSPAPPGIPIAVNPQSLLERVHIAPNAPGWFFELVRSVLRKYSVDCEVVQSQLNSAPLW